MKNKIIFILFLFLSLNAISQNKKFSIEVNYPLSLNSNQMNKAQGLVDASLKFRFADTDAMTFGVSYTFDWLKSQNFYTNRELNNNQLFHHVDAFGEFKVNGKEKLHPFVGIGFSLLSMQNEYIRVIGYNSSFLETIEKEQESSPGFNLNFGVSYDISSKFFIQSYFHYTRIYKNFAGGGDKIGVSYDQLKLGVGYRF